jgi:hypothetical protein
MPSGLVPPRVELQVIMLAALDHDLGKAEGGGFKLLTKPIQQSALWGCIAGDRKKIPTIASEPKKSAPDKPGIGRAPVLVVEDSPVNLELSVATLESMGVSSRQRSMDGTRSSVTPAVNSALSSWIAKCPKWTGSRRL